MNRLKKISLLWIALTVSGCGTKAISTFEPYEAEDLNDKVQSGQYQQKVDNLLVIVDASASMSEKYKGTDFTGDPEPTKLSVEKEVLRRLNKTLPEIPLSSGIRSFGFGTCMDWGYTKLNKSVDTHTTASFAEGIDTLVCSSGGSPMPDAFKAAASDLASTSGNIAVLVLSDGYQLDASPAPAAQELKEKYGDRLCVYSIWIGGEKEKPGRVTLQKLSNVAGCGFVTDVSKIASQSAMADYVAKVFFNEVEIEPEPLDTDGDGVPDVSDKCPNTPKGAKVDKDGCWAYHGVFFDFDESTIKPEFQPLFDNAVFVLNQNPDLTVEIQGHTDDVGTEEYNLELSEKRAQAVKDYLVSQGIDESRLTVKGFGKSNPAEDNDTEEGRAYNRRVYFERTDQ